MADLNHRRGAAFLLLVKSDQDGAKPPRYGGIHGVAPAQAMVGCDVRSLLG
jgi:hypothetical protein